MWIAEAAWTPADVISSNWKHGATTLFSYLVKTLETGGKHRARPRVKQLNQRPSVHRSVCLSLSLSLSLSVSFTSLSLPVPHPPPDSISLCVWLDTVLCFPRVLLLTLLLTCLFSVGQFWSVLPFSIPCWYRSEASVSDRIRLSLLSFGSLAFHYSVTLSIDGCVIHCCVLTRTDCKTRRLPKIFILER